MYPKMNRSEDMIALQVFISSLNVFLHLVYIKCNSRILWQQNREVDRTQTEQYSMFCAEINYIGFCIFD